MNLWRLRLSILGTLAVIFGITTLILTAILSFTGSFNFFTLALFVIPFNLIQWLLAPYLIDYLYRVKEVSPREDPEIHRVVERLSARSGIEKPKVMLSNIPVPNAFAYGSPITGTRVAVTSELLRALEMEEVEAVLAHELGHIKHRDVQVMMFVSLIPAIFYYLGWSLMWAPRYGREDRAGGAALIGLASMVVYWVLSLLTLHLSRLREYYADSHSVSIVEDGSRKLSEALAKISLFTSRSRRGRAGMRSVGSFKALFISDPERAEEDVTALAQVGVLTTDRKLVERILQKRITTLERITEIFSTHPNIVKRIRAILEAA